MCSGGAMDLLERMLVFDPSKRITVNPAALHELAALISYKMCDMLAWMQYILLGYIVQSRAKF
jgi:serine/threonine protein kinase